MLDFNVNTRYRTSDFYRSIKPEVIYAMQALTQMLGSGANMQGVNTEAQAASVESPNDDVGDE